ncbi:hypothetical protein IWX90DRAFT_43192 [Phyllosticta citrichinensis]|uniref:Uncharacterized protein n=1 Tax=Phyllosticta citrichinensis TaxID=1130410 RepID=A0ABR1Y8J3_9PEZI
MFCHWSFAHDARYSWQNGGPPPLIPGTEPDPGPPWRVTNPKPKRKRRKTCQSHGLSTSRAKPDAKRTQTSAWPLTARSRTNDRQNGPRTAASDKETISTTCKAQRSSRNGIHSGDGPAPKDGSIPHANANALDPRPPSRTEGFIHGVVCLAVGAHVSPRCDVHACGCMDCRQETAVRCVGLVVARGARSVVGGLACLLVHGIRLPQALTPCCFLSRRF